VSAGAAALFAQGVAALDAGDYGAAERIFGAIVERDPTAHKAWVGLAVAAMSAGSPDLAVERARRAVALDRKNADYLNKLGVAYGEQGDFRAAEQAFRRAVKFQPAYAAAHHNLAKTLQKQERLDESLREFERAYRLEPKSASVQLSLCGMYRLHGDPERALAVLRAATGDAMPQAAFLPHFADCLADVEGPDAALAWLRGILARQPAFQPARYTLGILLLSLGHWREGWEHYLWRTHPDAKRASPPPALPQRLEGKRVVLRGEYGLGDVLFFLRFAPQLLARGAVVAVECPPQLAKLAPLLAGRFASQPEGDLQVWIADLPGVLQAESAPPAFELSADGARAASLREQLARLGPPPYAGLTWRAGTDLLRSRELGVDQRVLFKEVPPALLGEAMRGWRGTLVSLQRAPRSGELRAISAAAGAEVHDLAAANEDLRDALALLALLDEYVAVSNTNMHLRAGLDRTARALVPNPPEWRWMRAEAASPWFPGFGVYRQPATREWTGALRRLREDLFSSAGSPRPGSA
jgi:Tfp pilus assembly protein PilF